MAKIRQYMYTREMRNIVVVDDEVRIRENLTYALEREGYCVSAYANGREAAEALSRKRPDMLILDIMMPRMSGIDLCRRIRQTDQALPILFLSSKDEELDRVIGLESGGDDYLCKPFSIRELLARIKVILKRCGTTEPFRKSLLQGELDLDREGCLARWKEAPLVLTITEFRILDSLSTDAGVVKSRDQLFEAAFPGDAFANHRAVDSHIKRLRRKILAVDPEFDAIETVYGLGYRFRGEG